MAKRKKILTIGENPLDSLDESENYFSYKSASVPEDLEDTLAKILLCDQKKILQSRSVEDLFVHELDSTVTTKPKKDDVKDALKIIKDAAHWSALLGMVPVPLADATLIALVQVRMIQQLCALYKVPFEKKLR